MINSSELTAKGKSGISWPVQECTTDPVAKFFQSGSKLSWHYNWNKNWDVLLPDTTPGLRIDAEFVPMIFSPEYLNNNIQLQQGWQLLLGFNEPDHHDISVAVHKSAAEAAKAWDELARLRSSSDIKLVSPAIAFDIEWLKEWFSLINPSSQPDYLAIHVYTTTFESFKETVEMYHDTFGLPIVITEFAMHNFSANVRPPQTQQQVHDFMGQTTKWLDETDWVVKYAWFGAVIHGDNLHGVHSFNRLMDERGKLTPLGQQYIAGGHE